MESFENMTNYHRVESGVFVGRPMGAKQEDRRRILMQMTNTSFYQSLLKGVRKAFKQKDEYREAERKIRYTDAYRNALGTYYLENLSDGNIVTSVRETMEQYRKYDRNRLQEILAHMSETELLKDMIYSYEELGFQPWQYFAHQFDLKSINDRIGFLPGVQCYSYYRKMNDPDMCFVLDDKNAAATAFHHAYKRDLLLLTKETSRALFCIFCRKHSRFIVKPIKASLGKGVRIVSVQEEGGAEKLYDDLLKDGREILCEELIEATEELAKFHPSSINCVRMYSCNNGQEIRFMLPWLKIGVGGKVVDNAGAGGLIAAIDVESGIITSDGANEWGDMFQYHPDTGLEFRGQQIPAWQELKEMLTGCAKLLPEIPIIGWDVALSRNQGWQIVEGNRRAQIYVHQVCTQESDLLEVDRMVKWILNARG